MTAIPKTLHTDFKLTGEPLDISLAYTAADDPQNGAVVLMSGMVRNQTAGRAVTYLDYQAYESMSLQIFRQIAQDCQIQYPEISRVVIHHRLGQLKVGEISVLIAVGSPHRAAAFNACSYAINALKQNAPIWKKEYWLDGTSSWVNI
ncbi:molybdopterin converting factor, large subunit [Synechococcus sp. PCC 7502]|uniref:molybdenum cofactor biosynthesis protein MoaE n=1 Tax=Synechococcus sp. PCC 7502 TaxID=1173263 RepID=UPI00029FA805|nr:molybdenum cofactor biosynthesis protein MoaE [Synechococcus sp. PCC 7502]AFY74552.1 molybdopterin converting factor, large subunit [Synechococcus sp. PCC 7502]